MLFYKPLDMMIAGLQLKQIYNILLRLCRLLFIKHTIKIILHESTTHCLNMLTNCHPTTTLCPKNKTLWHNNTIVFYNL